ncbi:fungal hydrophobin [Fistulina hepatica ATCC 64428]|nr:fungal hydrophobin [Fistulina hepatica ATCC 64428]
MVAIRSFLTIVFAAAAASAFPALKARQQGPACIAEGGAVHCCNTMQDATTPNNGTTVAPDGLIGALVGAAVPVSLTCTPVSAVIGIGESGCHSQTYCCTNNTSDSLVDLSCTPINADL